MTRLLTVLTAGFAVSWWVSAWFRKYATAIGLVDRPSARSSHLHPTPTAGGIGIVSGCVVAAGIVWCLAGIGDDWKMVLAMAFALALLGWFDDRKGLGVRVRFLCQCAAALGVIGWAVVALPIAPDWYVAVLALIAGICLVGLTNLFNFMDGIDGLAGSQAVFISGTGALLGFFGGAAQDTVLLLAGTAAASAGFLMINWPPARLFMGDTGSLFLGFLLAAGSLLGAQRGEVLLPVSLILWAPFLVDTSITLASRLLRGAPILAAHREHAYQFLAFRLGAHRRVVLLFLALNLCWLLPLALVVFRNPQTSRWIVPLAFAPIVLAVLRIRRQGCQSQSGK